MTEQIVLKRRPADGTVDGTALRGHPRERDAQLVERLLSGHQDAWQEFIDCFSSAIFGAIINTLRKSGYGSDDSHDITQDVFLRLCKDDFRLLRQFDARRAGLKTWLGVIASSSTIDHLRRKRTGTVPIDDLPEDLFSIDPETRDPIRIPDGLLSERQALVLRLLYDKDMDAKEVAGLLGIDSQTVRSTHHKALVKLRRYFAAEPD